MCGPEIQVLFDFPSGIRLYSFDRASFDPQPVLQLLVLFPRLNLLIPVIGNYISEK
jgi:hypothetical protein